MKIIIAGAHAFIANRNGLRDDFFPKSLIPNFNNTANFLLSKSLKTLPLRHSFKSVIYGWLYVFTP